MKRMISVALSLILMAVFAFGIPAEAVGETHVTQILTGKRGVSLRSEPNGAKITGIHANVYLDVEDQSNGWYFVYYNGMYGWVTSDPTIVTITKTSTSRNQNSGSSGSNSVGYSSTGVSNSSRSSYGEEPYEMGVPYLGNTVYRLNMMNMTVFWVQTQLKATGIWYQGYQWDVTGNLGDHTMSEIKSFMQSRGYHSHLGVVDQNVIDEIVSWMGGNLVPVYVGGFYDAMGGIMVGGSAGSMYEIVSNLRDMVPRETFGARWVQCILKGLGYYTGAIDGKYGEGTENAVKRFQKDNGFQETDKVTLGVARAMLEQYYWRGGSLNALP